MLGVRDLMDACTTIGLRYATYAGVTTIEMICAVFESHRQGGKTVRFPLTKRGNGLREQ